MLRFVKALLSVVQRAHRVLFVTNNMLQKRSEWAYNVQQENET